MPTPQNGQTHSNKLLTNCFSVFDHFVGLVLKGLMQNIFTQYPAFQVKMAHGMEEHNLIFWEWEGVVELHSSVIKKPNTYPKTSKFRH